MAKLVIFLLLITITARLSSCAFPSFQRSIGPKPGIPGLAKSESFEEKKDDKQDDKQNDKQEEKSDEKLGEKLGEKKEELKEEEKEQEKDKDLKEEKAEEKQGKPQNKPIFQEKGFGQNKIPFRPGNAYPPPLPQKQLIEQKQILEQEKIAEKIGQEKDIQAIEKPGLGLNKGIGGPGIGVPGIGLGRPDIGIGKPGIGFGKGKPDVDILPEIPGKGIIPPIQKPLIPGPGIHKRPFGCVVPIRPHRPFGKGFGGGGIGGGFNKGGIGGGFNKGGIGGGFNKGGIGPIVPPITQGKQIYERPDFISKGGIGGLSKGGFNKGGY